MGDVLGRPYRSFMVSSIEEMDDNIWYQVRSFERFIVARGRVLSEALRNDTEAPHPKRYGGSDYYKKRQIKAYVGRINSGAGVVEAIHPLSFPLEQPHSHPTGIYFLKLNDEIVYVGQAQNVLVRLQAHALEKEFDAVDFMPCLTKDLSALEGLFIRLLRPSENGRPYAFSGLSAPKSHLWDRIVPIHGVRSKRDFVGLDAAIGNEGKE